jgi:bifunctional DNA-binding transcriptional regulator/antitoxin component of YhaV-PrlF toxin-antitoxin module
MNEVRQMPTTMTLTAKGQFTFNKQLMEHLGVKADEKILVRKQPDGSLKLEAAKKRGDILSLAGSLESGVRLTDEELKDAIREFHIRRGLEGLA